MHVINVTQTLQKTIFHVATSSNAWETKRVKEDELLMKRVISVWLDELLQ